MCSIREGNPISPKAVRFTASMYRSPPLELTLTVLVGDDRGDDDHALHDFLVIGIDAQKREARRHNTKNDGADHPAGDASDAARERSSADHRCGDATEPAK